MQGHSSSDGSNEYVDEARSLKDLFESEISRLETLALQLKLELKEKEEAQQQVAELKHQLKQSSALINKMQLEVKAASEEAELTSLQLHQVQEELEQYFFQTRCKDDLIQQYQAQQSRIKKLISKVIN